MNEVAGKLDFIQSKMVCRIDKNSEELKRNKDQTDRNTDQINHNRSEIERLHKRAGTEHHHEQTENYSQFAGKKSKNLLALKNEIHRDYFAIFISFNLIVWPI